MISWLDIGLVAAVVLVAALGLILLGRPHLLSGWRRRSPNGRRPRAAPVPPAAAAAAAVLLLAGLVTVPVPPEPARGAGPGAGTGAGALLHLVQPDLVEPREDRLPAARPVLQRRRSDHAPARADGQGRRHRRVHGVVEAHPATRRRLAKLVEVARAESFRLGIVYQGLDFAREPLPFATVAADLTMFADRYATDPVFDIFGKPVVVWTGTARFIAADIDNTVRDVRNRLLVLGDAKSVEEVNATAPALDGQAYYWSSVDPERGQHGEAGRDVARRAPHRRPVDRAGGARVRRPAGRRGEDGAAARRRHAAQSFPIARSSEPDAIGVISWNEFSENTHIEPSERYGATDINVLADLLGAGEDIPGHRTAATPAHRTGA